MSNKYSSWLFYNRFYNKGILFCKKKEKERKGKDMTWRVAKYCDLYLVYVLCI